MKKITILSILTVSAMLLMGSCSNNQGPTEAALENVKTQTSAANTKETEAGNENEKKYGLETEEINLDNGKKWKVVDNMMLYIRNMEKEIGNFASAEDKNYIALSVNLKNNIDLLTKKCTMEGQAHDELHKWLVPYIELVDKLSEAEKDNESAKYFREIQDAFVRFNKYFV